MDKTKTVEQTQFNQEKNETTFRVWEMQDESNENRMLVYAELVFDGPATEEGMAEVRHQFDAALLEIKMGELMEEVGLGNGTIN